MRGGEKHKGGGRRPAAQADDIDAKVKQTLTHQEHALLQRERQTRAKGALKVKTQKEKRQTERKQNKKTNTKTSTKDGKDKV